MLALNNVTGPRFIMSEEILAEGCEAARQSARRRIILPLHRTQDAAVQRMLNFLQPETYIAPHVHGQAHASETICVLKGRLGFLIFDERGQILEQISLSLLNPVIDIEPNVWHGFVALEQDTVILEIKKGPYDATLDKEFAAWAPKEGSVEAGAQIAAWAELFSEGGRGLHHAPTSGRGMPEA
jgi:cupin fold WbuC family metalloprotein